MSSTHNDPEPHSQTLTVRPGRRARTVVGPGGRELAVPSSWTLVPPGDAALTRKVKALGPTWTVKVKRGRREMSRGVWAPAGHVEAARAAVTAMRAAPGYERKLKAGRARRARAQEDYVREFTRHVLAFLDFHPRHAALAEALAERVAAHATPVGSGTVARTSRVPVAQRAEAAVIAWLRHQTTAYDRMKIVRVKGARRQVRRQLAARSRELLERYRRGDDPAPSCPLQAALAAAPAPAPEPAAASTATPASATTTEAASAPAPASPEEARRRARMAAVRRRLGRR